MRLALAVVAVGSVLAVAFLVVGPREIRPDDDESAGTPAATSGVASLPALEPGAATLADFALIEDDFTRNAALYALIGDATPMRVEAWLAETDGLPATPHRYDVARVLYIRFAAVDPEAALQHALRGAPKASWLAAIFRTWGQLDPDAAAMRAGTLLPSAKAVASRALLELDMPRDELRAIAERLGDSRPDREFHRVVQLVTGESRPTPSEFLLAEIEARAHARREGESHADAWNRAVGVEDALVRQILVEQTVLDWALHDPVAAMAAVQAWDTDAVYVPNVTGAAYVFAGAIRPVLQARIVLHWAQRDAQAALSWAMSQEPADMEMHVPVVLGALAEQAPGEAIARLADLPEAVRRRAAGGVLSTLARTDLDRALRLFETLGIEEQTQHAMALRQNLISQRQPRDALDWALSLDRRIRPREIASVIQSLYFRGPAEALQLFDTIEDSSIRVAAASGLAEVQARRDAREALAWARNFRPEKERPKLVALVFHTWSLQDPEGACRALFETRGGPTRDRAAAAMMPGVVGHDIPLAERLFDLIESPEHRADAAQTLYRHLTEIEPSRRKAERYRKYLPEDDDPSDNEGAS